MGASLVGGNGNDVLTGGTQTDVLEGRDGNDTINGGAGNDHILPGYGSDQVDGGAGNDYMEQQTLSGEADVLGGGADDDFIWSQGGGNTQFDGGPGNDLLVQSVFTSGVPVVISGGEGEDEATLGNGSDEGIAVSLDDQANDGPLTGGTSNVHSDVENLNTDGGPDVIVGSAGPNVIRSDTINFNGQLSDRPGANDTIDPGGGVDDVFSGGGDDRITATDQVGDRINCGTNQTAPPDNDTVTGDSIDAFFACENINAIPLPILDTTHPKIAVDREVDRSPGVCARGPADQAAHQRAGLVRRRAEREGKAPRRRTGVPGGGRRGDDRHRAAEARLRHALAQAEAVEEVRRRRPKPAAEARDPRGGEGRRRQRDARRQVRPREIGAVHRGPTVAVIALSAAAGCGGRAPAWRRRRVLTRFPRPHGTEQATSPGGPCADVRRLDPRPAVPLFAHLSRDRRDRCVVILDTPSTVDDRRYIRSGAGYSLDCAGACGQQGPRGARRSNSGGAPRTRDLRTARWNPPAPAAVVGVMAGRAPIAPGMALFPLRLFLGGTFVYAGIQKLSDPGFLNPDAPTYIGTQLHGFADGTPGGPLLDPALSHAAAAGVGVALLEILIGVLVVMGVLTRPAAAIGLALNLVLFLTASWHTVPYFLGSDIVFVFAWLPFVLVGAEGQPTVAALLARRPVRLRRTS